MTERYYAKKTAGSLLSWIVCDSSAEPHAVMARCITDGPAKLIAEALNRLPETEREFRNERLATRRAENNSPDAETN